LKLAGRKTAFWRFLAPGLLLMTLIFYSLICLALCAVFKTVLCSFRETEDGGIGRLREKYPNLAKRTSLYEERWGLMTSTLSLLVVLAQVAAVVLLLLGGQALALPPSGLLAAFAALVLLELLFVEILPEILADRLSDRLSVAALPLTIASSFLFMLVLIPLRSVGSLIDKSLLARVGAQNRPSTEDEIISLMEQAEDEDIELHEKEFIRSVFEFDETDVHEIMTPRVAIEAVTDTETVAACAARISSLAYSRYPVCHAGLDDIQGIVHVRDLMVMLSRGRGDVPISQIAAPAAFVPESMKISKLFDLIKLRRTHLAVVVDEYGGTAGVVSLEDVIEELIGDIQDERDHEPPGITAMPDGSWLVRARESVAEVNEATGLAIPESEQYDSVGGYIFESLNRIPLKGEMVSAENFEMRVEKASERQIELVRICPVPRG
jgi:putative hemolysin